MYLYSFKINRLFVGKWVLVIGVGNLGCDCVVEVSWVVEFMAISLCCFIYIIFKFFMGKFIDMYNVLLQCILGFFWVFI